jgi:Fibrinogen beta and gamma chains, C-terminal globular domain
VLVSTLRVGALLGILALTSCEFSPGTLAGSVDALALPLDGPPVPARDCLEALQQRGITNNGIVTIDPDGPVGAAAFDAYCDMTTDGGGWTLVYVYAFTDFANFNGGQNAATPRPTWALTSLDANKVPTSSTVPTSPTTVGALEFARWTELGSTILVTSNINHWLRCVPNGGNLVAHTDGPMTCSIVQVVASACTTTVPTRLLWYDRGPTLLTSAGGSPHYYYWEASLQGSWPTHDPCGANALNHVTTVASPGGAIWLRR